MRPVRTLALAAAVAGLAASAASAQSRYDQSRYDQTRYDQPRQDQDRYSDRSGGSYQDRGSSAPDRYGDNDRGQAAEPDLARELSLRSDQQAALSAYKAAFALDEARDRREEAEARRLPNMTTPERLDYSRRQMEAERADFERTDAATRRFYAQLSPAQRRTFDRITAPPMDDGQDDRASPQDPTGRR